MFSRTTDQQNHVRQATIYVTDKTLCRQTSHRHFKQVKVPKEIHDYVYHQSKCRVMPRIIRYTRYQLPASMVAAYIALIHGLPGMVRIIPETHNLFCLSIQ